MANKPEHPARWQPEADHLRTPGTACGETVHMHEIFRSDRVWRRGIGVFDLSKHPKAERAYARSHPDGPKNERERSVDGLGIPPVDPAKTAVQAPIVADGKGKA